MDLTGDYDITSNAMKEVMKDNTVKSFLPPDSQLVKTPILGMDLRDVFAANAPEEIPAWFIAKYAKSENVTIIERDGMRVIELNKRDTDPELYFRWRYYYADQMMKQRETPNQ